MAGWLPSRWCKIRRVYLRLLIGDGNLLIISIVCVRRYFLCNRWATRYRASRFLIN